LYFLFIIIQKKETMSREMLISAIFFCFVCAFHGVAAEVVAPVVAPRSTLSRMFGSNEENPSVIETKNNDVVFQPCSERQKYAKLITERRFNALHPELMLMPQRENDKVLEDDDGKPVRQRPPLQQPHPRPPHQLSSPTTEHEGDMKVGTQTCYTAKLSEDAVTQQCVPTTSVFVNENMVKSDVFRVHDFVDVHFDVGDCIDSCALKIELSCKAAIDGTEAEGRFKTIFVTVWSETVTIKPTFFNLAAAIAIHDAEQNSTLPPWGLTEAEKLQIKEDLKETTTIKWPCTVEEVECDENGVPTHELPDDIKQQSEYANYLLDLEEKGEAVTPFHAVPEHIRNSTRNSMESF
jgi:hypothetical protein